MDGMEKEGIIISAKRIDAKIKVGKKLFDTKEEMFDYFIKLEKENEQLKKDKEYLDRVNNEQTEVILKLNKQIEKMKCCENCRYYAGFDFSCNVIRATKYGATKDKNGEDCNNLDKWELAE